MTHDKGDDKLASIPPLGKSVEEVEADNSNRVNPPALPEDGPNAIVLPPVPVANTGVGTGGNVNATGTTHGEFETLPEVTRGEPQGEDRKDEDR